MLGDEKMNEYGFGLKESMLFLVTIMLCIFITMFMYNKSFKEIFEGPSIKSYIDFAKTTKINAFVVDIKDNCVPAYNSSVYEIYSPTNYKFYNFSTERFS